MNPDYAIQILHQCLGALQQDIISANYTINDIGQVGKIADCGMASGGTKTTLKDKSQKWNTNQWAGYFVRIVDGTGAGQRGTITNNEASTLTISEGWTTPPDNSSVYEIYRPDSVEIDLSKGAYITAKVIAPVVIHFLNPPPDGKVSKLVLSVSGNDEIVFPEGTLFPQGIQPEQGGNLTQYHCFVDSRGVLTVYEIYALA